MMRLRSNRPAIKRLIIKTLNVLKKLPLLEEMKRAENQMQNSAEG